MSERKGERRGNEIMKNFKLLFLLVFSAVLTVNSIVAQSAKEDFKVLGQGSQSNVEKPFIFVARDAQTYAQLQKIVEGLPSANTINFEANAVVAAFAGTKSTGGYAVQITKTSQTNMIDLLSPPKGSMNIQIITQPYKIVLIPISKDAALSLDSGANWANAMENFRVTSGNFESVGGIAGKRNSFAANGGVSMWTYGEYVTIFLNLRGMGNQKDRRLMEHASGAVKNGKLEFSRLDAGNFIANPRPPFGVSGTISGKNLFLNFSSQKAGVADGFTGSGKIGAVSVK